MEFHRVVDFVDEQTAFGMLNQIDRQYTSANRMGSLHLNYADKKHVQRDLDWAELLLRRERWATVDVTNKSIEECAAEIIALQRRRTGSRK